MSSVDLKTSILVNKQVPEFIRDEYPMFITFLEAYYEFLEASSNTGPTSNTLITTSKSLRDIRDVDYSIDDFETNFYNTYGSLVPLDVQADKALLFKHLAPLYRTKGSESSFKLLFQLVYGEDIDVILPKNNVLRTSASKWQTDNKLRINSNISTQYLGNGTVKSFYLAQEVGINDVTIFVNGVLKNPNVDYFINKEYRKLNFVSAPASGAIVVATYDDFKIELLNNRKVTGLTSGASAIIELAGKRIITDTFNLGLPVELLINNNSLDGSFLNGETVTIPINDETNNVVIDVRASTFSIVKKINVTAGGNNYSVGDTVSVFGGNATVNAFGTVETITSGFVDTSYVHHGGALFTTASPIAISGNSALSFMTAVIDGIDLSGANAANSLTISSDVISNLSLNVTNVYVNSSNWGAVFSKSNLSAANTIADALNYITIQAGPVTNVKILLSTIPLYEKNQVVLDALGAVYGANTPLRSSKSLRSVSRYKINNGGLNYKVGDEIVFGASPLGTYGQEAAATVSSVAANGYILRIDSANSRIRGTASVTSACNEIVGVNTFFTEDLIVGDKVDINNESRIVTSITGPTGAVVTSTFTHSATGKKVGVFNRHPKGGYGYTQNNFPSITVSSATGTGASVEINSLSGDGERLSVNGFGANGQILSVKVIDPGSGYEFPPTVSISGGDGSATANAEIERSYLSSPGRWTTTDSILSSTERKIQGKDYYVDYSYIISSRTEFSKYKRMLKELLHPVGMVNYAFYNTESVVELTDVAVETRDNRQEEQYLTISGTVNVGNSCIVVAGQNTKFNVANTIGIITVGAYIAVNGEQRRINSIVSNTQLLTSSNLTNLTIVNSGSGYSNGYLTFTDGGGTITSLTITNTGSGYESGDVVWTGVDEAITAVATVVANANGCLQSVTLVSGGLYSNTPIALPQSNPHRVIYANGITVLTPGAGYSNGFLNFSGGTPIRPANARIEVHNSNGTIRTITIDDSGLYETEPTVTPNTNPNVVITSVTVTSRGNGHSNSILTLSGGDPSRPAIISVETFPQRTAQVTSIVANSASVSVNGYVIFNYSETTNTQGVIANARVYVNTAGYIQNVTLINGGTYTGAPTATLNTGNAVLTVTTNSLDGQIRKISIVDSGLYTSAPTAVLNTAPVSILGISANSVTYNGVSLANGNIVFTGGDPVIPADVSYEVFAANGVIRRITVNHAGLYRRSPTTATPNIVPVSITESYPIDGGSGYVNGNIIFSTSEGTANIAANAVVTVNGTGSIVSVSINKVGLYANAADIIVVGVLNPATAALQSPTTAASFRLGYSANTLNVANLSTISTAANTGQTAVVAITASSNTLTNATFSVVGVANVQTTAVISVGFLGKNTSANASVEVYSGNGAIRNVTLNYDGNYYYKPTIGFDSAGTNGIIKTNDVTFTQTANAQTAIIVQSASAIIAENYNELVIETGEIFTAETDV